MNDDLSRAYELFDHMDREIEAREVSRETHPALNWVTERTSQLRTEG